MTEVTTDMQNLYWASDPREKAFSLGIMKPLPQSLIHSNASQGAGGGREPHGNPTPAEGTAAEPVCHLDVILALPFLCCTGKLSLPGQPREEQKHLESGGTKVQMGVGRKWRELEQTGSWYSLSQTCYKSVFCL